MQLSWHGQYTVKIQSKETVLVIDPYAPTTGLHPFRSKANIIALTNPTDPAMSYQSGIQGDPTIISTPGEYSIAGFTLYAIGWTNGNQTEKNLQLWVIEDLSILHIGSLNRAMTDTELQSLEKISIDILLLPIGGGSGLDVKQAMNTLTTIEPRIVIPIHYQLPGLKEKLEKPEVFLKEAGASSAPQKKLIVKAGKLPQEDLQIVMLDPVK